jgi:hypothetical protein
MVMKICLLNPKTAVYLGEDFADEALTRQPDTYLRLVIDDCAAHG